jgi:hypothetical protein
MKIKSIQMVNPQEVESEEDFDKGEFWGIDEAGNKVRLYYFDEDLPVPRGYEEVEFTEVNVFPVAFFKKVGN